MAGARHARPEFDRPDECPLCPGGAEWRPAAPYWFPNRWPALPNAACAVVAYGEDHAAGLDSLTVNEVAAVLDIWAELTEMWRQREDVHRVLPFENRGAAAGQTLRHPHCQVFGLPAETDGHRTAGGQRCDACDPSPFVVLRTDTCRLEIPRVPLGPYPLRVVPHRHIRQLGDLSDGERREMAELLRASVRALDRLFEETMPYHLWLSQAGRGEDRHLTLEVVGLLRGPGRTRIPGAVETATGSVFTPMAPREVYERLSRVLR